MMKMKYAGFAILVAMLFCAPDISALGHGDDDEELGAILVNRFLGALQSKDMAALESILAPDMHLVRTNSRVLSRAQYMTQPAHIDSYRIDEVAVARHGDVLVVSYRMIAIETIDGQEVPAAPANRLSVFREIDGNWQLIAHGNFAALK